MVCYVSILPNVLHKMVIPGNIMENEYFEFKMGENLNKTHPTPLSFAPWRFTAHVAV